MIVFLHIKIKIVFKFSSVDKWNQWSPKTVNVARRLIALSGSKVMSVSNRKHIQKILKPIWGNEQFVILASATHYKILCIQTELESKKKIENLKKKHAHPTDVCVFVLYCVWVRQRIQLSSVRLLLLCVVYNIVLYVDKLIIIWRTVTGICTA